MTAVFSQAAFTIVVACGDGIDTPLPGVSRTRKVTTSWEEIGDLHIRTCLPRFGEIVPHSIWATRGWTYQEALLSRRKLYVSSTQVFWVCQLGTISEDHVPDVIEEWISERDEPIRGDASITDLLQPASMSDIAFRAYMTHSVHYNTRLLTNVSDIYNAFTGIMSAIYPPVSQHQTSLYNLPLKDFDAAILRHPHPENDPPITRSVDGDTYLPSWSWSSIVGEFRPPFYFFGPLVKWFMISSGNSATIQGIDASESVLIEDQRSSSIGITTWTHKSRCPEPIHYVALGVLYSCLEETCPQITEIVRTGSFALDLKLVRSYWPTYSAYWHDAFGRVEIDGFTIPISTPGRTVIATRAQPSFVELSTCSAHDRSCRRYHSRNSILDHNNTLLGSFESSPTINDPIMRSDLDHQTLKAMAISVGKKALCKCCPPELEHSELFVESFPTIRPPVETVTWAPVVNIMLLREQDGMHSRYSIGWIYLRLWANLKRRFETIVLC